LHLFTISDVFYIPQKKNPEELNLENEVPGPVFLSNDQETDLDKQDKNWESNHTK
jgi:hypothetical protein